MAITNREQVITLMGRCLAATDKTTLFNLTLEWMNFVGHADVTEAFIGALNRTGTIVTTALAPNLLSDAQARRYTAHTQHDRL